MLFETLAVVLILVAFLLGRYAPETVHEERDEYTRVFLFVRDASVLVAAALGFEELVGLAILAMLLLLIIFSERYARMYPVVALALVILSPTVVVASLLVLAAYVHGALANPPVIRAAGSKKRS